MTLQHAALLCSCFVALKRLALEVEAVNFMNKEP